MTHRVRAFFGALLAVVWCSSMYASWIVYRSMPETRGRPTVGKMIAGYAVGTALIALIFCESWRADRKPR